jgi:hypothetical protein
MSERPAFDAMRTDEEGERWKLGDDHEFLGI